MKSGRWTASEIKTLERLYPATRPEQLSKTMNRSHQSIYMKAFDLGLKKCPTYLAERENSGRFTSHNRPKGALLKNKSLPIGSIRLNSDGNHIIKFTNKYHHSESWKNWRTLLYHIWQESGRAVPANHFVAFKEGRKTTNPSNIHIDMLECVTMSQFTSRRSSTPKEVILLQREIRKALTEIHKSKKSATRRKK